MKNPSWEDSGFALCCTSSQGPQLKNKFLGVKPFSLSIYYVQFSVECDNLMSTLMGINGLSFLGENWVMEWNVWLGQLFEQLS